MSKWLMFNLDGAMLLVSSLCLIIKGKKGVLLPKRTKAREALKEQKSKTSSLRLSTG